MIVRMKHLDLVCLASEKDATLERLRALGAVHLDLAAAGGAAVASAEEALSDAEKAVRLILKARGKQADLEIRPRPVAEVLALAADRATLVAEQERLEYAKQTALNFINVIEIIHGSVRFNITLTFLIKIILEMIPLFPFHL